MKLSIADYPNPRYKDKYIVAMTEDESVNEATSIAFEISKVFVPLLNKPENVFAVK